MKELVSLVSVLTKLLQIMKALDLTLHYLLFFTTKYVRNLGLSVKLQPSEEINAFEINCFLSLSMQ